MDLRSVLLHPGGQFDGGIGLAAAVLPVGKAAGAGDRQHGHLVPVKAGGHGGGPLLLRLLGRGLLFLFTKQMEHDTIPSLIFL